MKRRTFLAAALAAVSLALSAAGLGLREAAAQVASAFKPRPRGMRLPPIPKWNQATDDIDSADYYRRCGDFERSLLPSNLVFPRTGQIWEAVRDCDLPVIPLWSGEWKWPLVAPKPPAIWPTVRLRRGEKVRILELDNPKPVTVPFVPVRYAHLRPRIGPQGWEYQLTLRIAPTFPTRLLPCPNDAPAYFSDLFRLVEDVA